MCLIYSPVTGDEEADDMGTESVKSLESVRVTESMEKGFKV